MYLNPKCSLDTQNIGFEHIVPLYCLTEKSVLWGPPPAPGPKVDRTGQCDHQLHGLRAHIQAHVSCRHPRPPQPLHTRLVCTPHQLESRTVTNGVATGVVGHTHVESQMSAVTTNHHLSWCLQGHASENYVSAPVSSTSSATAICDDVRERVQKMLREFFSPLRMFSCWRMHNNININFMSMW